MLVAQGIPDRAACPWQWCCKTLVSGSHLPCGYALVFWFPCGYATTPPPTPLKLLVEQEYEI